MSTISAVAVRTPAAAITSLANALEPSMRAAAALGPKQAMPGCPHRVGDARDQRDLGPDDDEVGRPALGQRRDGPGIGEVDAVLLGDRGRARVAGRARQRGDAGVLRERENDRMLTSTGTDHEDAHDATS